jgi:hypothetical protein
MKTKLAPLLVIVLLLFASFKIPPAEKVLIKLNLKKGEIYDYRLNMNMNLSGDMKKEPMNVGINMEMDMRINVNEMDKDGNYALTFSVLSAKGDVSMPKNQKMKFDSKDPKDKKSKEMAAILKKIIFEATMAPEGRMLSFNMDRFFDSIAVMMGPNGAERMAESRKGLDSVMNSAMMKKSMQARPYPNYAVGEGDTWSPEIPDNTDLKSTYSVKNTVQRITDKNIVINTVGDINTKKDVPKMGEMEMKGKFLATQELSLNSFMLSNYKMKMDMDSKFNMQGEPLKMKINSDITMNRIP